MTNEAIIVMQMVVGGSLVLAAGVVLQCASRRHSTRADLAPLLGYYLISGGALLTVGLTDNPGGDSSLTHMLVALKLGYVAIVCGIAYLACLCAINKDRHRRALEKVARRTGVADLIP